MDKAAISGFRQHVYAFYRLHKRNLPWRNTKNPYRILVSEMMLQQTQVSRVFEKYPAFLKRFPDIKALGKASLRQVMQAWQGLGFNRRALCLQKAATIILKEHRGSIPAQREVLKELPGIGEATSGALLAFAFDLPVVFIETNIRSVFIHYFFHGRAQVSDDKIMPLIEQALDKKNPRDWYYALMDYGVYLKQKHPNPSRKSLHYKKQSRFEGSFRQIRGRVLKFLTERQQLDLSGLRSLIKADKKKIAKALQTLCKEGLLKKQGRYFSIT